MKHRIAVIGGDGIGPDVVAEALKVLRAAGADLETTELDLGGSRYLRDGEVLSDASLAELQAHDAIFFGAAGRPDVPPGILERGLIIKMRTALDLYVKLRPFSGTAPGHSEPHEFDIIRENTEGAYVGEGGLLRRGTPDEVATQGSVNTRQGVERTIRYAFDLTRTRDRSRDDDGPPGRVPDRRPHPRRLRTRRRRIDHGHRRPGRRRRAATGARSRDPSAGLTTVRTDPKEEG